MDNNNIKGADDFIKKLNALKQYLQQDVKEVIGTEAVRHFKKSFTDEGFTDEVLTKWDTRKTKMALPKKTLTGQGSGDHLSDSIEYKIEGNSIIITTDRVYAQIHNEGGTIPVTPKMKRFFWAKHKEAKDNDNTDLAEQYKYMALATTITIPKRQFIGNSTSMNNTITQKIKAHLTKIFNP